MHIPLHLPPLYLEGRAGLEAARLRRSAIWLEARRLDGGGRPVLLVPGFLAGDASLQTMTRWLAAAGYRPERAGIRANVACSEEACRRLQARVEALADKAGEPVAIIGHSRGGMLARALAVRHPDLVAGIVTLGSPVRSQLAVHPVVLAQVGLVAALGSSRVPGLFSWTCLRGTCCAGFRQDLAGPFPAEVGYVALYSRSDGVVDWRACLDPAAGRCAEVESSHCGMAMSAAAYAEIAGALAGFGGASEAGAVSS
jgi:pimeloyl-ACP methyl ester carboxylesterase